MQGRQEGIAEQVNQAGILLPKGLLQRIQRFGNLAPLRQDLRLLNAKLALQVANMADGASPDTGTLMPALPPSEIWSVTS